MRRANPGRGFRSLCGMDISADGRYTIGVQLALGLVLRDIVTGERRTLVFNARDSNGNWRLMQVPAEGGQPIADGLSFDTLQPLLPDVRLVPGNFNNFDLHPDGSRIVVSMLTMRRYELWTLDYLNLAR
jgi:hypothetical protein